MLRCVLLYYSGALAVARIAPHALRERDLSCLVRAVRSRAADLYRGQHPMVVETRERCGGRDVPAGPIRLRGHPFARCGRVFGARGGRVQVGGGMSR